MRSGGTAEASLVAAARAGDRHAVDALVTAGLPLVYSVVRQALGGHPDADDVVQDVMLRALRQLPTLRKADSFRPWLAAIAVNQVGTHLHRQAAGARRTAPLDEAGAVPDPGLELEDLTALQTELSGQRRQVGHAGYWLDPGDRVLLSLWLLEVAGELSRSEVAAALGASVAHTGVRIQRMRRQLDAGRELVAALDARPRCPGLQAATAGWDGVPAPLWRKRLLRHTRSCPVCRRAVPGLIPVDRLLPGFAVLLPVPVGLAAAVLGKAAAAGQAAALGHAVAAAPAALAAVTPAAAAPAAVMQAAVTPAVAPAAVSGVSGAAGASTGAGIKAGIVGQLLQSVVAHPIAATVTAGALAAGAGIGATTLSAPAPPSPGAAAAPVSPDPPAASPGRPAARTPARRSPPAVATTPASTDTVTLAPGRPVSLEPADRPGRYVTTAGDLGVLAGVRPGSPYADRRQATFTTVTGLADAACFSFRTVDGRYLRHSSWRIRLDPDQGTALFRGDATFCAAPGTAADSVTLEASNYPGWFVHRRGDEVWVDQAEASDFRIRPALAG